MSSFSDVCMSGCPVEMLVLVVLLCLVVLVVSLTVVFVALKLLAHFRAVARAEEEGRLGQTFGRKEDWKSQQLHKLRSVYFEVYNTVDNYKHNKYFHKLNLKTQN